MIRRGDPTSVMVKTYIIVRVAIRDPADYQEYMKHTPRLFSLAAR
ncbi:MAG: hypothetical protein ACI8T1_003622 [Verrucomicrobiales bacterium]|jgi:uncharacterized protein (DUF1330 family)